MRDLYPGMRPIGNNIVNAEILVSKHNMQNVFDRFIYSLKQVYRSGDIQIHPWDNHLCSLGYPLFGIASPSGYHLQWDSPSTGYFAPRDIIVLTKSWNLLN